MSVWCGNPFASACLRARSKSASAMRMVTFFEALASRARRCAVPGEPSHPSWLGSSFARPCLADLLWSASSPSYSFASHRVTPEEVEQMFANDEMGIDYDQARVLSVVFTMRDDAVRPVTAYEASGRIRTEYFATPQTRARSSRACAATGQQVAAAERSFRCPRHPRSRPTTVFLQCGSQRQDERGRGSFLQRR